MTAVVLRNVRNWGGPARLAIAALAIVAILFLFVFPTRSFLSQRAAITDARHDVNVLRAQNELLEQEAARLQTPTEIESMAREQFHMVYEGERAFTVTPAPAPTTTTP